MNITDKLQTIQLKLDVPKNQRNEFGKFNYRSAEDILKAIKPLLEETKTALNTTFGIERVGDSNYIRAKATLYDLEKTCEDGTPAYVSAIAYAREPVEKKGMDASQITGASSSYAKKYALCALFAIDDGIDNDMFDNREKPTKTARTPAKSGFTVDFKAVREKIKNCKTEQELTKLWFSLADPKTKKVSPNVEKYLKEDFSKRKDELLDEFADAMEGQLEYDEPA